MRISSIPYVLSENEMFQTQCRNLQDILAQGMHNRDLVVSNKITCIARTAPFGVTAHYCHERSTSGFTLSHQELLEVTSLAQSLTYASPFDWAKLMASERHSSLVTSIESPSSSRKVSCSSFPRIARSVLRDGLQRRRRTLLSG